MTEVKQTQYGEIDTAVAHLRHQRAFFAVIYSGVPTKGYRNVQR
jgi:hypothetical protein